LLRGAAGVYPIHCATVAALSPAGNRFEPLTSLVVMPLLPDADVDPLCTVDGLY
jgi:hypothetical protein